MGRIGFKSVTENTASIKIDSLETLGRILQEVEEESCRLEDDLKAEIKNIEHLKSNIKILEGQVAEAEEYLQRRRKLVLEILARESSTEFKVDEARDILNKISHLDQIIGKKITVVGSVIRRYILNEATQILTENVQHQNQIAKIDEAARKLLASTTVIAAEINAHSDALKRIYQMVKVRENQPRGKVKPSIGF